MVVVERFPGVMEICLVKYLKAQRPVLLREQAFDEVMKYLYRGVSILLSTRNPMVCLQLISTGQPEYIRI